VLPRLKKQEEKEGPRPCTVKATLVRPRTGVRAEGSLAYSRPHCPFCATIHTPGGGFKHPCPGRDGFSQVPSECLTCNRGRHARSRGPPFFFHLRRVGAGARAASAMYLNGRCNNTRDITTVQRH
jgi:hypothetical protein